MEGGISFLTPFTGEEYRLTTWQPVAGQTSEAAQLQCCTEGGWLFQEVWLLQELQLPALQLEGHEEEEHAACGWRRHEGQEEVILPGLKELHCSRAHGVIENCSGLTAPSQSCKTSWVPVGQLSRGTPYRPSTVMFRGSKHFIGIQR